MGECPPAQTDRLGNRQSLPDSVQTVLDTTRAAGIAEAYRSEASHFFIDRGNAVPVALEGALKVKGIERNSLP